MRNMNKYILPKECYCVFCKRLCKNLNSLKQHETRCSQNPKRKCYNNLNNKKVFWNKGQTKETNPKIKEQAEKQSNTKKGKSTHRQTEETKQKLREYALQNGLGGFNMRKHTIFVNGLPVDSTYEKIVAEELSSHGIAWVRPSKIKYIDNKGKLHHYTPDFYLPEYDVYLDPKNDYLINNTNPRLGFKDLDKIKWVMEQNNIVVIILDKNSLNYNAIIEKIAGVAQR